MLKVASARKNINFSKQENKQNNNKKNKKNNDFAK